MEPRHLLQALMTRNDDNPSSLSRALAGKTTQPQIFKFLRGVSKEPRRATLAPVAEYYKIPLDAFYDSEVAETVARDLGLAAEGLRASESPIPLRASSAATPEQATSWPFKLVTFRRFIALPIKARLDIDQHLEILAEKWERAGKTKGRHG